MAMPQQPTTPPPPPTLRAAEQVRVAHQRRNESDYLVNYGTALGWALLTCFAYFYYIFYQQMRRHRDHNLRRLEMLDGATTHAWDVAGQRGLQDELRPYFERISGEMATLRNLTTEFRDPVIWLVLAILTGLAF